MMVVKEERIVREGYKMTELGEIPVEWKVKTLGDLGETIIGLTYKPENIVPSDQGTLVLRSSNILGNNLSFNDNKYVNLEIPPKLLVKENDILICSRNGSKNLIGKTALIRKKDENMTFGAFMSVYRSPINLYLYHCFKTQLFKKQINSNLGATINQITTGNLKNFKFPIPPLREQQKIAEILSTVDEQIENIEQLSEKTKELKKGLMQQLLTKGIGHTEYKMTELGEIPVGWEETQLDKITKITRLAGAEYSDLWEVDNDGEIIALRGYNIGNNKLLLNNVEKISRKLSKRLLRSKLFKGDIVFPCVGTIGKATLITEDDKYHINQNIAKITSENNIFPLFLVYFLMSPFTKKQIKKHNTSSSQPNVLVGNLRKFTVPVPSYKEQQKIAEILSSVDEQIDSYTQEKEKYSELKRGLMQQLLTGKVRVTV